MDAGLLCQSCTMPIDNVYNRGSEKDGTKSTLYCRYCYVNGAFTNPGLTLEQMRNVIVTQMLKNHIPGYKINQSVQMLPHLRRWEKAG